MGGVNWIKITTSMFDDEKIRIIESMPDADTILIIWVKLLTLCGKCNANGYIMLSESILYTDEMLATIFNRPLSTVRMALKVFKDFGMLEETDHGLLVCNWEKHQNVEGLEKIRQQGRLRQQKYREKQKQLSQGNATVTSHNAPEEERDIDKEVDIDKEKDKKSKGKKSPSPSKVKYAEFVQMTEDEYNKLLAKHGFEDTQRLIEILDNHKGAKGANYKSDYRAILKWVENALEEEKSKKAKMKPKAHKNDPDYLNKLRMVSRAMDEMEGNNEQGASSNDP